MTWFFIKGVIMTFPIFIIMGIVGNLIGGLTLSIFTKTGHHKNVKGFLKFSIYVSFIIGAFFFAVMGMFYASYTFLLTSYMAKWLAITLTVIFLLIL